MNKSHCKRPVARRAQPPAARRRGARALLFLALSAAAVPACQHFDGDDNRKDQQARAIAAPAIRAATPLPADPRLPPPRV